MADQTVIQHPVYLERDQTLTALRKTAQAMAVLQVMWVVIEGTKDGCVNYGGSGEGHSLGRWHPSAKVVEDLARSVRDTVVESVRSTDGLDVWEPLSLCEALSSALWVMEQGLSKGRIGEEELQDMIDVALESLTRLHASLGSAADRLKLRAPTVELRVI